MDAVNRSDVPTSKGYQRPQIQANKEFAEVDAALDIIAIFGKLG